jgi:VWFA-related protein
MVRASAVLLASTAIAAAAQDVPDTRVELVRLDVVVTDKNGQLVRGLGEGDFAVLEDGKPQRLTHFVAAGRTPHGAPSPSPAPEASPAAAPVEVPAPAGPARTIVIVVDELHIAADNIEEVRRSLRRMLDEFVAVDDRVALIGTGSDLLVQPTTDRAALKQAIGLLVARPLTVHPGAGSRMTPLEAEMILAGDPAALRLAADRLLADPSDLTANAPFAMLGERQRAAENQIQRQARALLAESLRYSSATLSTLSDVLRSMAPREGRKLCLMVSDGFQVGTGTAEDRQAELRRMVDASLRTGSVVYVLTSAGLTTGVADPSQVALNTLPGLQSQVDRRGEQIIRDTLERVADDTGGFVVRGTNDLAAGLRRMLDDNEVYYLMAYEPANKRREGRFRRIEVQLPRHAGLTIRTRKGYLEPDDRKPGAARTAAAASPPPPDPAGRALDEAEARALLSTVPAGASPAAAVLPVRLTADWFDLPPAGPRAVVRAHFDLAHVFWREAQGLHHAVIEIVGGVYDTAGKAVGNAFGKRAALDLAPREQERLVRSGLHYQELLPLAPGRYEVRLVAHERGSGLTGGAAQWIEIPDLGAGALAVSSVFLSAAEPAIGENGQPAEQSLHDAQTLRRFKPEQSLYFQLYVYNAARDGQRQADVVLQAQIRSAGKVVAASRAQPAALQVKDGVPVPETNGMPLQGLAAGPYELRVVVIDRKANVTVARSVDFTVE